MINISIHTSIAFVVFSFLELPLGVWIDFTLYRVLRQSYEQKWYFTPLSAVILGKSLAFPFIGL
nr:MAG TPA: hypothetical protein [Caudoviricetes sp.]